MALPDEAVKLNEERLVIVKQIEELKVEARVIKKQMDSVIEKATLAHKLGGLSDGDKAKLRELLDA